MKKHIIYQAVFTYLLACTSFSSFGQGVMGKYPVTAPAGHTSATAEAPESTSQSVMAKNATTAVPLNYTSFTKPYKNTSTEATAANAGYASHPEAGLLFPCTPCDNCYELVGLRTENTKTFEKEGRREDGGKDMMTQTSTMPMHYRDAAGNWITIRPELEPDTHNKGVYAATQEEAPVVINTNAADKFSSVGKAGENIEFNHNLELVYEKNDGRQVSLGVADWTNHTAGDEGVYVTNAWPGVDIEMHTTRNAVKTSFHINHAMPAYADGRLLIRDHLQLGKGLSLASTEGTKKTTGTLEVKDNTGITKYIIGSANVYEQHNFKNTVKLLSYSIGDNNTLDITLPGSYLNGPATAYPVIIDPLVSLATTTAPPVVGFSYNALWTALMGCEYTNAAMTPPNCTLTDIQFAFAYTTTTVGMEFVGFSFYLGACRSPGTAAAGFSWSCNTPLAGTCTSTGGAAYSIWGTAGAGTSGLGPCVPAPSCPSIPLNINAYFYQNWLTTPVCVTTYATASSPLIITVIGHTVELTAAGVTGTPATICAGASATLNATGTYGVPPYTYSWSPGPVTGTPATVTPATTTTYTLTVTDACGITTGGTTTITVNPTSPINGVLSICIGNATTLTDATAGGTWSSSAVAIASAGVGTGVVTGIAAGTATITYTTAAGCKAYAVVTVTPLPVAITGTPSMCQGSTTTLADTTPGGAWSSSNTAVATVSATGVVTGVAAGTATITYGNTGCIATITVTVNPTPAISSTAFTNPTTCNGTDGTITLSGLIAGASYTVNYTAPGGPVTITLVADATGNITITSLGAGNYTGITVTNSFGCVSNSVGPITLVAGGIPPTPVATNSSPVCAGGAITFTATDAATGVTYSWTGPGGFTSALQNPTISAVTVSASGTYQVTVTLAGCTSLPATTVVVVNPVPVVTLVSSSNPTVCQGTDGTITINISGLATGVSYNVTYLDNGISYGASLTSDASDNVVITGLNAGTYGGIYVTTPVGCVSNQVGPVTLTDPNAPPAPILSSNTPLCVGQTLSLSATDAVSGGTYTWLFPDGTTSTLQNVSIPNTTYADTGIFIATYDVANCLSPAAIGIALYPPIVLINPTPNTAVQYGSSIQLNVDGALYYWWSPDNGTLNNPNINNPVATPKDSTVYTVIGTSLWGCQDTANITITVINPYPVIIPSAFTPNGDGLNDIFRLGNLTYQKLVEFSVYNRWGQLIYHNASDPTKGWDGTFNGVVQDLGVYNYCIILSNPDGTDETYKGTVTLIK